MNGSVPEGEGRLTHVDEHGRAHMVDVTGKEATRRLAEARCRVTTTADPGQVLAESSASPDGMDLLASAQVAGVMAAKQTSSLLPLCHPIRLDGVEVVVDPADGGFVVVARTEIIDRTGVEMEALTACAVAALVLVQPLLDRDPEASIDDLTLWLKTGGRTGTWRRTTGEPGLTNP
jgi:cyclic pyranopterin monophosphate synthase